MANPLITEAQAAEFGVVVSGPAIARASARIRAYCGQHLSAQTVSIFGRGPRLLLPQRPVRSITYVRTSDSVPVDFEVRAGGVLDVDTLRPVEVRYAAGFLTLPDHLVEFVATTAKRFVDPNTSLEAGVQQETGGSESVTFGWDSFKGTTGLLTEEKVFLDRLFPALPQTIQVHR